MLGLIGIWGCELRIFVFVFVVVVVESSQRKNVVMLDNDDTDSVSSSSTSRSEMIVSGAEEVHVDKETLLDQCVDALYEKRFDYSSMCCVTLHDMNDESLNFYVTC